MEMWQLVWQWWNCVNGDSCDGVDDSNSSDDAVGSDGVSDDWDCSLMMVIVVLMVFTKMVMKVCMLIMMVKLLVI
jgi:hypothetical protein